MKLFYGVQGTGNGHITRAREMAKALAEAGVEVTYMFSGRAAAGDSAAASKAVQAVRGGQGTHSAPVGFGQR